MGGGAGGGGRRNLSKEAAADLIGQVYNQRKQSPGGNRGNQYVANPQNEDLAGATCDAVASELGVGRATVERGGAYDTAIDRLTALLLRLPPASRTSHVSTLHPWRRNRNLVFHGIGEVVSPRTIATIPPVGGEVGGMERNATPP